jgi:hypothetical protein
MSCLGGHLGRSDKIAYTTHNSFISFLVATTACMDDPCCLPLFQGLQGFPYKMMGVFVGLEQLKTIT